MMNQKIKLLLINTCGTISYLIVIFFFVTFILFLHNDVEEALKEAWSVSVSFLSVLATLGAAIIAANLFNDWKVEQHFQKKISMLNKIDEHLQILLQSNFEILLIAVKLKTYTSSESGDYSNGHKPWGDIETLKNEIYELRFQNIKFHSFLSVSLKRLYAFSKEDDNSILLIALLNSFQDQLRESFSGLDDENEQEKIHETCKCIIKVISNENKYLNSDFAQYLDEIAKPK